MSDCAGKECFWMDYTISDPKAERFDANYASGSMPLPPQFNIRRENGKDIIETNPYYNLSPFPNLRKKFAQDALAEGIKQYTDSSKGCADGCSCSILDNPDPKEVKTTTFRAPFKTSLTENFDDGSSVTYIITGTYKVTAVKRPGICVAGEHAQTPNHSIKYDLRELSQEETAVWQEETKRKENNC